MAWFEVFIPGKSKDVPSVTLTVEAPNWIGALRTGLSNIGEGQESISNVMCDIKEDNSIHVTDVASHRVFRLREVDQPAAVSTPPTPPPEPLTAPVAADTQRMDPAPGPAPVAIPAPVAPQVDLAPTAESAPVMLQSTVPDASRSDQSSAAAVDDPPTLKTTLDAPTGQSTIEMSIPWTTMPSPTSSSPLPSPSPLAPTFPAPKPAPMPDISAVSPSLPENIDETLPLPVSPPPSIPPSAQTPPAPKLPSAPVAVAPPAAKLPSAPVPAAPVLAVPAPMAAPAPAVAAPAAPGAPAAELTERVERAPGPNPARKTGPVAAPTPRGTPAPPPKRKSGQFDTAPRPISREVSREEVPAPAASGPSVSSSDIADAVADVFDATQDLLLEEHLTIDQIANTLLEIALAHVPAESGSFYIADVNAHALTFAAVRGPKAEAIRKGNFSVPVGQGIVGFCALEGVCLGVKNIAKDPRYYAAIANAVGYQPQDTLCASAEKDGRLFGAVQLINSRGGFTAIHMEVLRYIALTAAQLLERQLDTDS